MELVIDIGNSAAKSAVFNGDEIICREVSPNDNLSSLNKLLGLYDIRQSIVSTVAGIKGKVGPQLRSAGLPTVLLNEVTVMELNRRYGLPPTMGSDRLAAIVEARALYPGRNILVIDSGSCITYEFISPDGTYLGGNISPGVYMRLHAMHIGTALLPQVSLEGDTPQIGYDTDTAMRAGSVHGVNYEIEGYIRHLHTQHPDLVTIISGGTDTKIDSGGAELVFDRDLVMKGLRRILLETGSQNGAITAKH